MTAGIPASMADAAMELGRSLTDSAASAGGWEMRDPLQHCRATAPVATGPQIPLSCCLVPLASFEPADLTVLFLAPSRLVVTLGA